jgi:hypothetical protein
MSILAFARITALASGTLASVGPVSAQATQLDPMRLAASIQPNRAEAGV